MWPSKNLKFIPVDTLMSVTPETAVTLTEGGDVVRLV